MRPLDPRLLRHASATRRFIALSVLLGGGSALLLVAQAFLIASVVAEAFLSAAGLAQVGDRLLLLAAVSVARSAATWLSAVVAHRASAEAVSQLRSALMARAVELGPAYLSGARTGELASLATRGANSLSEYFSGYLPQLILAVLVPLIVGVAILTQDPLSALIVALTVPIIPVFMVLVGRYTQARVERQWDTLGVLSGHFLDVVAGLTTLKLFGRAKAQAETIRRVSDQYRSATLGVLRVSFLSALVLELLASLSVAIVAVAIGVRLVHGTMDLSTGLAVLILAPEVYLPLRQLGAQFHAAVEGVGAAERMLAVIEAPSQPRGTARNLPDLSTCSILVADLQVRYGDRAGLGPVSFEIPAAQVTVLAGPSGCGKSTLLAVLLGLVGEPTATVSGRVELRWPDAPGGPRRVDLADVDPQWLRQQIGWVGQSPAMLPGTVADNVRLGSPAAGDEQVRQAMVSAGLDPLSLPDGLATRVGERGAGLSVGQVRRVGIARALLRDCPIYLLDEPTAALDVQRESDVRHALTQLSRAGRTVVVVSHRPGVMALADNLVRLPMPQRGGAAAPDGVGALPVLAAARSGAERG